MSPQYKAIKLFTILLKLIFSILLKIRDKKKPLRI